VAIRIVRLGSPRYRGEGLRIGTVRRPPRGVPKKRYAADDWFDVWLPSLAPSAKLLRAGRSKVDPTLRRQFFDKHYLAEMNTPENGRLLNLLAALSHSTNFSVGCYCELEKNCHRSILRRLLRKRGALIVKR
jgi:uncharacterized protein YeaO (DUF488 family)